MVLLYLISPVATTLSSIVGLGMMNKALNNNDGSQGFSYSVYKLWVTKFSQGLNSITGEGSPFTIEISYALFGVLIALSILVSLDVFRTHKYHKDQAIPSKFFIIYELAVIGIAIGLIIVAWSYQSVISDLTYLYGPIVKSATSTRQSIMIDYEMALFNKCCYNKGWSSQGKVTACTGDLTVDCSTLPSAVSDYKNLLCVCVTKQSQYDTFYNLLTDDDCSSISAARVYVDDNANIPGTQYSIRFLIPYEHKYIPLVGVNQDLNVTADPDNTLSFGCGFGFAKGFEWATAEWFKFTTSNLTSIAGGIGIANLIVAFLSLLIRYLNSFEDKLYGQSSESLYERHLRLQRENENGDGLPPPMVSSNDVPMAIAVDGAEAKKLEAMTPSV